MGDVTEAGNAFCGACGAQIAATNRFCGACGASQEPFVKGVTGDERESAPPEAIERRGPGPAAEPDPAAPDEARDGAVDHKDALDELTQAIAGVKGLESLEASPDGQLTKRPVGRLLRAAEAAYAAGLDEEATAALDEAFSPDTACPAETVALAFATSREEDCEFRTQNVEGLEVHRIDLKGSRVMIEDLDIELLATDAGTLVPRPMGADETPMVTMVAADLQLFGPNDGPEEEAERVHARGFDSTGLWDPELVLAYEFRILRRLLWGMGHCVLTDHRVLGLIYQPDETPDWSRMSPERAAMPTSLVLLEEDDVPVGTVLIFSINRLLASEDGADPAPPSAKLRMPLLIGRNIPDVAIDWGAVELVVDVRGVVDEHGKMRKPRKGEIAAAAKAFAPSQPGGAPAG